MNWQAPAASPRDPFAAAEADVRAMTSSPWWAGAVPHQRTEAVTARMLAGAGEWWFFGVWGRWYRCGLDGAWHLCPPPLDPAARQAVMPAPPGAGRPPVPPSLLPSGPDLTPGPLAGDGLFGAPPAAQVLGRLRQTVTAAASANPAQFVVRDPQFASGTPGTVAVCLLTVLWCAGAPVAAPGHPVLDLFTRHLSGPAGGPRWFPPPALPVIVGAYTERLRAGDPMGASYLARVAWETAEALRAEPAFRPRADAFAAMTAATLRMVPADHGAVRFGEHTVVQEWLRRCPAEFRVALLRETSPGDHFRLTCYDLAAAAAALPAASAGPAEARRVALALLAADLDAAPGSAATVLPWLDPEAARTLQAVLGNGHPLRALWPAGGVLPDAVAGADPRILRYLLAASYTAALAWSRLANMSPPAPGFTVPAALMRAIGTAPQPGGDLSPWEIIEAARAHLAEQRRAEEEEEEPDPGATAQPATTAWPNTEPGGRHGGVRPSVPGSPPDPSSGPDAPMPPAPSPGSDSPPPPGPSSGPQPATTAWPDSDPGRSPVPSPPAAGSASGTPGADPRLPGAAAPTEIGSGDRASAGGAPPAATHADAGPGGRAPLVEAYGITFLPGPDDVERLLAELRRRGKWALSLRGQDVSSASAPAVLLAGGVSCGQRRLTRMIAKALAEVGISSGEVHTLLADDLAEIDPRSLRETLAEHSGHTLLIEDLDTLILDHERGAAYASALYRARVEGVSETAVAATCAPGRLRELTDAVPELITDFRTVRLPDLSDPDLRVELASLLATERHVALTPDAWQVVRADLATLRGRGRLTNARLVEAYLDRGCSRHLSQDGATEVFRKETTITLSVGDLHGVAAELEP